MGRMIPFPTPTLTGPAGPSPAHLAGPSPAHLAGPSPAHLAGPSPCEHQVNGHCRKVDQGSPQVSPALCAACPAALVKCPHLQFTLRRHQPAPITVRLSNGRAEAWDDLPPAMRFNRATCALRPGNPIQTPADCVGCALRFTKLGGRP